MSKGSPGGILLIAFGVLFVRLAYTGRISAVWDALMSGQVSSGDRSPLPPVTDPGKAGAPNSKGDWSCPKERPHAVWGCDGERSCLTDNEASVPITCAAPTTPTPTPTKTYLTYNAAGAPYQTNAGNGSL